MEEKANLTNLDKQQSVELVYKYIEHSLQSTSNNIGRLETRITTLFGFSGLLLRFTIDLPSSIVISHWNVGYVFQIVISVILFLAIIVSALGLFPKSSGDAYTANELLDELEKHDINYSMQYIALSRDKTLKNLDKTRLYKVNCLKWITFLVVFATLLFAIDISLSVLPHDNSIK